MPEKAIYTDDFMETFPYQFGRWAAICKDPCNPERDYKAPDCIVHYVMGYVDVAGPSEVTEALLANYDGPEINKEYIDLDFQFRFKPSEFYHLQLWSPIEIRRARKMIARKVSNADEILEGLRANPDVTYEDSEVIVRLYREEAG